VVVATLAVALGVSLWWLYFEHITDSPIELARGTGRSWMYQVWLYAHLPLTIALAAVGVGIEHVAHAQGPTGAADRWLLAGGVGLYFASLGVLMLTAIRFGELPSRLNLVATVGALLAVGTIATLGNAVPAVGVLGGIALVGVFLVLVDLYVESSVVNREPTRDGESTDARQCEG
jgi:low temperature requirement protein LtrA